MQEIKKRRIVIASVLKPVDDTRMYEKIGKTLAPFYEVHIIGYPSQQKIADKPITFFALPTFKRLSLGRISAPFTILSRAMRLKPNLFIATTHELLCVACILKIFTRCKVIYDIQENYYRNILFTPAFPAVIRPVIAMYVRVKEWLLTPLVNHFFLAEKGYEFELTFLPLRKTVIENKFQKLTEELPPKKRLRDGKIHLLFSGTLAQSTGVHHAINLTTALHILDNRVCLTIIGYCAQPAELKKIKEAIRPYPFIKLSGGAQLVPHADIIKEVISSDFGIISYPPNASTLNSIPTKLYEYTANRLPILLINHPVWVEFCNKYQAAISFDENFAPQLTSIYRQMTMENFYTRNVAESLWESEAKKLISIISAL